VIDNKSAYSKGGFLRLRRAGISQRRRGLRGSRKPDVNRSDNSHSARDRDFKLLRQLVRARMVRTHISKTLMNPGPRLNRVVGERHVL
jgi:hypothetical protein